MSRQLLRADVFQEALEGLAQQNMLRWLFPTIIKLHLLATSLRAPLHVQHEERLKGLLGPSGAFGAQSRLKAGEKGPKP